MIVANSQTSGPPTSTGTLDCGASSNCLYLGLNKEHRVSRTFRATWYIKTFIAHSKLASSSVQQASVQERQDEGEDIQVLGAYGGSGHVDAHTQVFYICQKYSLVFVLDMSSNMRAVSNVSYHVKLDEAVTSLCGCLTLLTQPFCIAGNNIVTFEPELCVTVLGYCGNTGDKPIHVFIQGVHMDKNNCSQLVSSLREDINSQENLLAHADLRTGIDVGGGSDVALEAMLRAGTLGIQLLPRSALKGVVLVTDGISGFPTPSSMHNTVASMSSSNVSCWVVHVGGPPHLSDPLGLVPDVETLNFVTRACNGCVIQPHKVMTAMELLTKPCPQEGCVTGPNPVQEAILLWSFQLSALACRVRGVVGEGWEVAEDPFVPIIHRIFNKSTITAPLLCVVGCKIREGFYLKSVQVKDVVVEVCLCYQWQPSVNIYYTITAPWPVSEERELLQVTTSYDGPYSFVHDFQGETNPTLTSYRATAIRKFKQSLQKFSNSDALLAHFLSFSGTSSLHHLPASVQDGAPLFHNLPNSTKPSPAIGVNTSTGKPTPLHQFWRPLCTVDTSQWYRWFHSDKLVLILRPEFPLPKNLLEKSASGRYGAPLCRPAASHLFDFLKTWSSLVLLEGHSYIRWLPFNEPPPRYFCLLRVAQKHPCMVLHIGYIEGTPHSLQSDTVSSLMQGLQVLAPPTKERNVGGASKKKVSTVTAKASPVVTIVGKQLQRVMIRYDAASTPTSSTSSLTAVAIEPSEKLTQMEYLQSCRWKWLVPTSSPHILTALLKCRLKEGYHVTSAHNGVVTLAAQLTVQQPSCSGTQHLLLQYVIFPYGRTLKSELWVEPQYGAICATPPQLDYLQSLSYPEITAKVHAVDYALVTEVTSFVHLVHTCQSGQATTQPVPQDVGVAGVGKGESVVEFQLSSLFARSSVCAITMTAFSEAVCSATAVSLPLEESSMINHQFWKSLSSHVQKMAPTTVFLSDHAPLLERLRQSSKLRELLAVVDLEEECQWTCTAMVNTNDDLTVFLLPWRLYCPSEGKGKGMALLPIIMFQCYREQLLNFDLVDARSAEDMYLHFDLATEPSKLAEVGPSSKDLLSQLSSLHVSCYLEQVHSALTQHLPLSREDFLRGVAVCQTSTLSVDLTPLLAGLCPHSRTSFPANAPLGTCAMPLPSDVLSQLLSAALSKLTWTCVVQSVREDQAREDEDSSCHQHTQQINQALKARLDHFGFRMVPQCGPAYFWLDSYRDKVEPHPSDATPALSALPRRLVPVEEEEEGTLSGMEPDSPAVGDSSSSDDEQDMDLVPLLSPPGEGLNSSGGGAPSAPPPLFVRVACAVRDTNGLDKKEVAPPSHTHCLLACLKSVLPDYAGEGKCVSVELVFSSLTGDITTSGQQSQHNIALTSLPRCYHSLALHLQSYLQWLICDELVSTGHSVLPISPGLLQGVATHIQTTHGHNALGTCFAQQVPLKFVFGVANSMSHFLQQLEAADIPEYQLVKLEDYYYLKAKPRPSSSPHPGELTPDLMSSESDVRLSSGRHHYDQSSEPALERSRTPPPPQLVPPVQRGHRRSMSSGHVYDHSPKFKASSVQTSTCGSELDMDLVEVGSGYEGGLSDDASSMSEPIAMKTSPGVAETIDSQAWIVLRVLSNQVDLYFQLRSSELVEECVKSELRHVCDLVATTVRQSCHRTNQWLLMKSMLDTRTCSPYLLSESASEAWVEEVVLQQGRRESFRAQEFECDMVHRNFLTPHWRIRERKDQAALLVTRSALSAFAVTNRRDVYVLQDVTAKGEESIFYVKVDESLCNVENSASTGMEGSITLERRDTLDADETQSTFSYQQSVLSELPETDKRGVGSEVTTPFRSSGSKPQESLVVQVYGISEPSQEFKDRLNGTIQHKLEAKALDIMCNMYARNRSLKLTPEDVEFLQPDRKPSHTLHLSLPDWLQEEYHHPFFFYFLQTLSTFALHPTYSSNQSKQLVVHQELDNAYLVEGFSREGHKDHLFLYIRPQHKGRGMAVLCVSLADSTGRVHAPLLGLTVPMCAVQGEGLREDQLHCAISEDKAVCDRSSIRVHVWEKGNIGLEEFMHKLAKCFTHTILDYYLEICLLPCPIAQRIYQSEELCTDMDMLVGTGEATPISAGEGPRDSPCSGPQSPNKELLNKGASEMPRKKVSVASYVSSSSSRRSSDSVSRRGSNQGSESRRGSGLGSESRRGSALASESTRGSFQLDSSRKSSLVHIERRRSSGEKGGVRNEEVWSHHKFPDGAIEEVEESARSSTASSLELQNSLDLSLTIRQEVGDEGENQSPWLQREKVRRMHEAVESLAKDAELGKCGTLTDMFSVAVPQHLSLAHSNSSPAVQYVSIPLMGHYSTKSFVSEVLALLESASISTTSDVFQLTPSGHWHVLANKDWTKMGRKVLKQLYSTQFILVNRNITQWEECSGYDSKQSPQEYSSPPQLFAALDSGKLSSTFPELPLQTIAEARTVFVPRRMLILIRVSQQKGEVWSYNTSDQCSKTLFQQLSGVRDQLATRTGLLHHLLAQKMGLYRHCMGQDIRGYSKLALNRCSTVQDVVKVIKNTMPTTESVNPLLTRRPTYEHISVETMYQDQPPYGPVAQSEDPLYNHGHQFRHWHTRRRKELDRVTLLGKVFRSWLSREGDASVPVSPDVIANLKRTARLLHYCTSPLLIQDYMATPISAKDGEWLEHIKDELLSHYINYLLVLGFQIVNERALSKVKPSRSSNKPAQATPPSSPPYKCLQRSWPGGIIMVELLFQKQVFVVKLYTLEGSRLQQSSPLSPENRSHFAKECARYKDFIHVHSFMHDFHLRFLLDLLSGRCSSLGEFNLCAYIELCHAHYNPLPAFAQNLLRRECLRVPTSVMPELLYRHLLSHCKEFGTTTLELQVAGSTGPSANEIGLLIDISRDSLGPVITPELSQLMEVSKACYSTKVLALYNPAPPPSAVSEEHLELIFYLVLVNSEEKFPCLTSDSPELTASCHALPPTVPEGLVEESDLNVKVREHRRRMGYGLMATPSASRRVLDKENVESQLHAVRTHLETVIRRALHHMRKDELWKRLLYGSSEGKPMALSDLTYSDFRDLLYLVTECPLDTLDPMLSQLKKQPRKWFKKLFKALKLRFTENIRVYSTENESQICAAIINPDWQDMLVLVQSGGDQTLSAVYRKPMEGGIPLKDRHITANLEADRHHIETVVNFCCSFMWASILDAAPPLPQLNLL